MRRRIMDEIMAEPIRMPGFPQIIVTRGWLWIWLVDKLGCNPRERGIGSVEWTIFSRPPVEAELTPDAERDALVLPLAEAYAASYNSYSARKREHGLSEMEVSVPLARGNPSAPVGISPKR